MVRVDKILDARNLLCPMPVIRTQEQVSKLAAGQVLEVVCTDPGAIVDIPAWCRVHGHKVLATDTHGLDSVIRLQVCGESN